MGISILTLAPGLAQETESVSANLKTFQTPIEKEHRPLLRVPEEVEANTLFFLAVQVGSVLHPTSDDHIIEWLKIYLDGAEVFQAHFSPRIPEPRLTIPLRIKRDTTLKVEAHCSRYGTWGTEMQIKTKKAS